MSPWLFLGLLCACAGAAAQGPTAPPAAPAAPVASASFPADLPALEAAVRERLRIAGIPGAAVVVIEKARVALAIDHGQADLARRRPVTPDTIFRAGSISKTLTAVAAMQLVEQGRLALDAPMATLLPEWPLPGPADATRPMRLEHLLEHSAGLDDIHYRHYLIEGADITLAQALPLFGPYRARWAPGEGTAYSNAGPIVVGRVIESLGASPFDEHMARSVTGPLGMPSARWRRDAQQADMLAASYGLDARTPERFVETPGRPSGSLSVTARDLARVPLMLIGRGVIDGRPVLQPSSVQRMERPGTSVAARQGVPIGWGLGLRADADGRTVFYGHDGSIDGFVAQFAYAPDIGAGYVVMANMGSDAALEVGRLVRSYLERALPPAEAVPVPLDASQRARWAGQYQAFTPRQELLRAVIGLTQWQGVAFDGDAMRYEGARWTHVGQGRFQKEGAAAPALLFVERDGRVELHAQHGAKRRVGSLEMTAKQVGIGLTLLAALASVVALPIWLVAAARGSLASRGGLPQRLWPTAALALALVVPLGVLALLGTGDIEVLGRPSAAGWAIFAASWLAPAVTVGAVLRLARHRGTAMGAPARALAWLQVAMATVVLGWLAAHGWIGIRIWDA